MFCNRCGGKIPDYNDRCPACGAPKPVESSTMFIPKRAALTLNLKEVFSDVFKRGNKKEGEKLFITGTEFTTPPESEIVSTWTKPWLFSRVLLYSAIIFIVFRILLINLDTIVALPAVLLVGSFAVPIAVLIFFWEANAPRNIPFYEVLKMFFIGGAFSILSTMLIHALVNDEQIMGIAALSEEPAKILISAYFIKKMRPKYILNGMLIGAAVGAGFAAFESAGYAFMALLDPLLNVQGAVDIQLIVQLIMAGMGNMFGSIFTRAFLAPGGHVVWAAFTAGALMMANKGRALSKKDFTNAAFIKFFAAAVVLHMLWNLDIVVITLPVVMGVSLLHVGLMIVAWVIVLHVLNCGFKQISSIPHHAGSGALPAGVQHTPVLNCLRGPLKGKAYRLGGSITIGRDSKLCNVIFPGSTAGISRNHCTISFVGGRITIADNQSSNGTFLANGTRVTSPVTLSRGDSFYLGSKENLFEVN